MKEPTLYTIEIPGVDPIELDRQRKALHHVLQSLQDGRYPRRDFVEALGGIANMLDAWSDRSEAIRQEEI